MPLHSLLPPWGDFAWREAAATPVGKLLQQQLDALEGADLAIPVPPLTPELYSEVHRTGARLPFERVWQERRRRLARAAVRLLLQPATTLRPNPSGVWWDQLLAAIQELLDEPSWAWPAHVQDPCGVDPQVIDLFAAETANLCGELVSLFGSWLPPALVEAMRERVINGMVRPFLADPETYGWIRRPSNWNAVCHQGLVGAALALAADAAWLPDLLELSGSHLDDFLAGFSPVGSCLEGITYWEYGFGWFALLNEQLELWSGGGQSLVAAREERVRAIARFGPAMLLRGGQLVNFADSRLDMPPRASLLMLLGRRLQLPTCSQAGIQLYRDLLNGGLDLHGQRCDLFYLTRLLLEAPTQAELDTTQEPTPDDWIDRDAGLIVCRRLDRQGRCWELAVKGGHNDEPHNHNDCGSFLLNVDGQRLALELGAPEYTADTFGPKRYTLLTTRSSGHSVPIVNGQEQQAGRTFAAQLLELNATPSLVRVLIDLTHAYPAEAGHQRLLRTITLDCKESQLKVEDSALFEKDGTLESHLLTPADTDSEYTCLPLHPTTLAETRIIQWKDNTGSTESARLWNWQAAHPEKVANQSLYLKIQYTLKPTEEPNE